MTGPRETGGSGIWNNHGRLTPSAEPGSRGADKLSLEDPAAVRAAAQQIQEAGQKIDALQAKADFGQRAAQSLPGTDIAKACERLDFDVKNLLKAQGRWSGEIAEQIHGAVGQIADQDGTNASHLNISF